MKTDLDELELRDFFFFFLLDDRFLDLDRDRFLDRDRDRFFSSFLPFSTFLSLSFSSSSSLPHRSYYRIYLMTDDLSFDNDIQISL